MAGLFGSLVRQLTPSSRPRFDDEESSTSDDDEESLLLLSDEEDEDEEEEDEEYYSRPPKHRRRRTPLPTATPSGSGRRDVVRKRARPLYATAEKSGAATDKSLEDAIYEDSEETFRQLQELFQDGGDGDSDSDAYLEHYRTLQFVRAKADMARAQKKIDKGIERMQAEVTDVEDKLRARRAVVIKKSTRTAKEAVLSDGVMLRLLKKRKMIHVQKARFEDRVHGIDSQIMAFEASNMIRAIVHTQHRAMRAMEEALPGVEEVQKASDDLGEVMTTLGVANDGIMKLFTASAMSMGGDDLAATNDDLFQDYADLFGEEEAEEQEAVAATPIRRRVERKQEPPEDAITESALNLLVLPDAPSGGLEDLDEILQADEKSGSRETEWLNSEGRSQPAAM